MNIRLARVAYLLVALILGYGTPAVFADPPPVDTPAADTTRAGEQPALPDSVQGKNREDVARIQEWLRQADADSADTIPPPRIPVEPPLFHPLPGAGAHDRSFGELADNPHTAFSDHLLWSPEIDAPATTDFGTERQFLYRGLTPWGVRVALDGIDLALARPTFPQTMAPDLMPVPPYLFSSLYDYPSSYADSPGEVFVTRVSDSLFAIPYSDFFVRRGDYGLSLTQGRLFRPLPGGRTANLGFSFAQSDGRGLYDGGQNRNLYAKVISPLYGAYNFSATWYQYAGKPDIQTAQDFWRYRFTRDDLTWRFDALLFRGDTIRSPVYVRFVFDHDKYALRTQSPIELSELYGEHRIFEKKSRASLAAVYAPQQPDSAGNRRAGITFSLSRFYDGAERFDRPEYTLWGEKSWQPAKRQTLYLSAMITGNDDDPPAPVLAANWRYVPGERVDLTVGLKRLRIIPDQINRESQSRVATFVDLQNRIHHYVESGNSALDSWWSNSAEMAVAYRPGKRLSLAVSGWASYEQEYFFWRDMDGDSLIMDYRPAAIDARTMGAAIQVQVADLGPFGTRMQYCFKRAEEIDGGRLPDYFDHRAAGALDADLTISKYNLELHGSAELHYWRAPSPECTAYNRRDVFRTDVLGSATIKDFTIYWLAQNVFNYGYRKAPNYNFLGSTIMWGLHLRFHN